MTRKEVILMAKKKGKKMGGSKMTGNKMPSGKPC